MHWAGRQCQWLSWHSDARLHSHAFCMLLASHGCRPCRLLCVQAVRVEAVGKALGVAQKAAAEDVSKGAGSLLEAPPADLWPRLNRVVAKAVSKVCGRMKG